MLVPVPVCPTVQQNEMELRPLHNIRQAVRRVCALTRRFYAGRYALFLGQHGRVFTASPALANPPKRDLVVKVLEQVYYKEVALSSDVAWGASLLAAASRLFIPRLKTGGFQARSL
jgi:hypothetical protein